MPSPFPGMDPYLEGTEWQDVHNSLAYLIKKQLAPQIRPMYFARLEKYVVTDLEPLLNVCIVYPDLEVWQTPSGRLEEPSVAYSSSKGITPPTSTFPFVPAVEVPVPFIEIRDQEENRLITTIEILSPVNKRNPGLEKYFKKQRKLHSQGVHLLEIDLLREGKRPHRHPLAVSAHYVVTLLRGDSAHVDIWAIGIKDSLPVVPVPLKAPDPDAILDLQAAFREVYDESFYADSVHYEKEPPLPAFSPEEQKWIRAILKK